MENLEFSLTLEDQFSSKMKEAGERTQELGMELLKVIGLVGLLEKSFEFLKEGYSEFTKINVESAILTNELKNQGRYSKELMQNLKEGREHLAGIGFYKEAENIRFQEQMVKNFPKANDSYRELFTENAANLATINHTSLEEAGNLLKQVSALRPTNKGGEMEPIKQLFKTFGPSAFEDNKNAIMEAGKAGHDFAVEIGEIINKISKNSAKLATEADPLYELKQSTEELSKGIGALADGVMKEFLPEIQTAVDWLKTMTQNDFKEIKDDAVTIVYALKDIAEILVAKKILTTLLDWGISLVKLFAATEAETGAKATSTSALEALTASALAAAAALDKTAAGALASSGGGGMRGDGGGGMRMGGGGIAAIGGIASAVLSGVAIVAGAVVLANALGTHFGWFGTGPDGHKQTLGDNFGFTDWSKSAAGILAFAQRGTHPSGDGETSLDAKQYLQQQAKGNGEDAAVSQSLLDAEKLYGSLENIQFTGDKIKDYNQYVMEAAKASKDFADDMTKAGKVLWTIPGLGDVSYVDDPTKSQNYFPYVSREAKEAAEKSKSGNHPSSGNVNKNSASNLDVKGVKPEIINITINDGLIKNLTIAATGLKGTQDEICDAVAEGIRAGIASGQNITGNRKK